MKFLGCCLSMNIPFPSLEVPCFILWVSQLLSYYECVSRFDLARLSLLRLGPTLPCPVHPPMSLDVIPGPSHSCILHLASSRIWTALLHTFCIFHLYFCTICMIGSRCILARRINRQLANALFQSMLQQKQIQVFSWEPRYSFAPHHCPPASWALREPP